MTKTRRAAFDAIGLIISIIGFVTFFNNSLTPLQSLLLVFAGAIIFGGLPDSRIFGFIKKISIPIILFSFGLVIFFVKEFGAMSFFETFASILLAVFVLNAFLLSLVNRALKIQGG